MWKTFQDNNNQPFTKSKGNLLFGLYIDWVNPHGIKSHRKSVSIGIILLFCYNLPPETRYKPHKLFIYGFTPTPKETKLDQLNNLLEPLIADSQKLWTGVFFNKTHKYPEGRTIKAAILNIMGDLPAMHKISGLANTSAKLFCAHCNLK